jgi:sugar O-acyltransferase (sialic acid O-acetyltransferase NeuD family)
MPTKLTVTRPADFVEFQKQSILQSIHQRIEEQVQIYPAATALKSGNLTYTYTELNGHANSVAHEILTQCGKGLAQVALLLPNTPEMIIGMLGSLKAHKAYVPLDRNYPLERLRAMFEDAEPSVLLTDDSHHALAEELAGKHVPIINISRIERNADAPNPGVECDPLDRAYILFTSGTTGRPKGIVFLHRNLLHTTMCLTNELFFSPSDRVTWLHSPSFGSSIVDIYCSLTNGAALYPWDPKVQGFSGLADWLVAERITSLQWLPSAFRQFMRTVPDRLKFQDIRIAIMAGEPLTMREVDLFRRNFAEGSHLVNQAGTAESYNYYLYRVDHQIPIEDANVPGGYPVSSERKLLILDDAHKEVLEGSVGEIAIQSDYMCGGYWRDETQTQAKFIRVGNGEVPVYLTGDLGRFESDGCLIHLGRKDFQFKIRGCRIEPADVENVLTRAPGVADCACWFAKDRFSENQLVGYVVLKTVGQFNQPEVEDYLEKQLPGYMVPRTYVVLDSLPSLPNGKANRKALPDPFTSTGAPERQPVETLQDVDQKLLHIFREILQIDQLTPDTDFLEAGGDSLSVAVLQHRIHESFGVNVAMEDLFGSLTPSRLSGLVNSLSGSKELNSSHHNPVSKGTGSFTESYRSEPLKSASIAGVGNLSTSHKPVTVWQTLNHGNNLVIIGAGQAGREAFTWATQTIAAGSSLRLKGFLDDNARAIEAYDYEPGVLGDVCTYQIDENDVFVSAIGDPVVRAKCCSQIQQKGGRFINIIHPLANIGLHVELGVGIVMGPFSSITCDAKVGNHTSIGAFSNVAHDTALGDFCQISSHCGVNGRATLGDGVFVGSHACILPRIKVGAWAFVGAGSIVVRDVPERVKVFGNPAAQIGMAT